MAIGALAHRDVLQGAEGVAHIGVANDAPLHRLQWNVVMGLDVMACAHEDDASRDRVAEVLTAVWDKGLPATLWQAHGVDRASRIYPFRRSRGTLQFVTFQPSDQVIGRGLREVVKSARASALDLAEPPLFSRPDFDACRIAA